MATVPEQDIRGQRAGEISASVEAAIRAGRLVPGDPLPPVRRLAGELEISPTTVAAAYRDLQLRGLVTASGRRGTQVAARPPLAQAARAVTPAGAVNLIDGNPDPALMPDLGAALARLRPRPRLYGEATNLPALLELGAGLFAADGVAADVLAVVAGALDGIERTLMAHLRPGDRVAVEDPCYPPVHDLLLALGLVPVGLPQDERGLLPDALEAALHGPLAALIVTPRAQNPTGGALDAQRARELRSLLAERPDVLLIEDDHAGPVAGVPAQTLSTDGPERWVVVRSFAKSLGPDLRVGVMTGDPVTISRVEGRQQLGTGWVSHVLQSLVVELWRDSATQRLIAEAAARYAERRQALLGALEARGMAAIGRSGFNVWAPVPDEGAALQRLLDAGWAAAGGQRFRLRSAPAIRISIGRLAPERAVEVAAALAPGDGEPARTRSG